MCIRDRFKAYRELYKCCITDKDKSVALNSFSLYYCTQDQKDSAIIIQRKALDYALDSGDSSMIGISEFNLSINYDEFEEPDSALYHACLLYTSKKKHWTLWFHCGNVKKQRSRKRNTMTSIRVSLMTIPIPKKSSISVSVSYTHLDVYKRQIPYWRICLKQY